jgi:hypothetical protein
VAIRSGAVAVRRAGTTERTAAFGLLAVTAGAALGLAPVAGIAVRGYAPGGAASSAPAPLENHAFVFTRAVYSGAGRGRYRGFGGGSWSTDYPKSDRQFLTVLRRLIDVDAYDDANPVPLADPGLRRFPFLYMLEVGYMRMTPEEVHGLRDYLLAGGFLMVDDFWGSAQWYNFQVEMEQVFPEYPIVELPADHPIFHMVYNIDEVVQVPNVTNARWGGPTYEQDGYVPHVRGIFDDKGRLMVVINWNTDLGDAWEWAEQPYYPVRYSTYAFQVGVNTIVYALSH